MTEKRSQEMLLGYQNRYSSLVQHRRHALGGQLGIEGQVRATSFEDAQEAHDELERTLDTQSDYDVRTHPEIAEVMTELVGPRIEFSITESLVFEHDRKGIGGAYDLLVEQLMEAVGLGVAGASIIPRDHDLTPLFRRHDRKIAQQLVRSGPQ